MIKRSVSNQNEEFVINRSVFDGAIQHQKRINQNFEKSAKDSYTVPVAPVLKYHTKSFSSNSIDFSSQKKSENRFVNPTAGNSDQKVVLDSISFKSASPVPAVNSFGVNEERGFSDNLCNSLIFDEKPAYFETSSFLSVPVAVSTSFPTKVGLTGSLITPARSNTLNRKNNILSDHSGFLQMSVKNRSKNSYNAKTLPLSQPSHFPVNDLSMFQAQQQKWLSSTVLPRYERPKSAKQHSSVYDSKAVNTVNSYLSKSDHMLKTVLPSASCSSVGNGTRSLLRPKSSYRQRLMNSHTRTINSNVPLDTKTSNQSIKGFCIVNQSGFSDSSVNSARSIGQLKKLKPVSQEQLKTKSTTSKDRANGLSKLNLAMKSSSANNGNTCTNNDKFNSIAGISDLPSITSSCTLCLQSKSNCTCQTNSKFKSSCSENYRLKSNNSENLKSASIHSSSKPKKVRPLTSTKKIRKKVNSSTDAKKKTIDSTISKFKDVSVSNSNSSTSLDFSCKESLSAVETPVVGTERSYGDGADDITKETIQIFCNENFYEASRNGRLPGDGVEFDRKQENEESLVEDFNYEDSLFDANGIEDDDDCSNELIEDAESIQGSDLATGEFICDDDDALDCIDDSTVGSLDEDFVGSECAESESSGAEAYYLSQNGDSRDENKKPAIIKNLFSNCPTVINFATQFEQIDPLPANIRKLLKWKMSTITPIVVRNTVMRSGFKSSKKNHDWMGYFGKHMKSNGFRSLREYQKINHFPGSFQLGRKDRLWRNMSRMQTRYGKKEFGFVPRSYVLPWDKKLLKNAWEEGGTKQKFILKPPASARGIGIKVIHKWNQIPTKKPIMVQKYLSRPYLINGNKFDLRLYVHVTSFDPLRIYLFDDGLVRFATCKYSSSMKHLSNKFMHLTNYSINKKSGAFEQNDNASVCQGHKWSLKALWGYMQQRGVNTDKIWEQMKDIVIKTIISVEQFTNSLVKSNCRRRYCCHELFGFDIMLDDRLRPWLLEVNISPSLHSNSPLDVQIKGAMVKDMFNLCGFHLPDKKLITGNAPTSSGSSVPSASASFSQDKRKQGVEVTADSRAKHSYFAQHYKIMDEQTVISLLLDTLTVNDIRILVEGEAEAERRGNFQKIFPCLNRKYLSFFEQPRYYNELLHVWEVRYSRQPSKGHELLESFCRRGLHLHQVVSDPTNIPQENVWSPNCMTHPKITPSPRSDLKITLSHSKQVFPSNLTVHSPTVVSAISVSNGRSRSAKPFRSRSEDAPATGMQISSKPINPLLAINTDT